MYCMIIGQYPFEQESREELKNNIINKEIQFTQHKRLIQAKKGGNEDFKEGSSEQPAKGPTILKTDFEESPGLRTNGRLRLITPAAF